MPPKKLDSGGQGQIYEVDKDTVYKIVTFSEYYKEISELAILHSLHHPSMIAMKKWELNRRECKIYMERMYLNLYDFAKKHSFEKRLEIFPQVFWNMVRVARFCQRNGIMNCDIKSENVMLSKDGKSVRIIDFGHIISDEDYPIIGTRSYQPPELWLDDHYTTKSMVWSIGMTCLEFLYRIHPIVDIIHGEDSDDESESSKEESASEKTGSTSTSFSSEDSDESDEYRQEYINLFEILMEKGESLPFRHRLDPPPAAIRDKMRVINNMIERMLTYDMNKRISLDELYHHRIFEHIRAGVREEDVKTKLVEKLYCDKEYTLVFLTLGRKLFREEIMLHAYTLLTTYLEKRSRPTRYEFMITSIACMDIMSYLYSMVPSSRDVYRKIVLSMRKITEEQIFDRAIDVLKSTKFNVFYHGISDIIRARDGNVVYPLLLEIMEVWAEQQKKHISVSDLVEAYFANMLKDDHSDEESSEEEEEEEEEPPKKKGGKIPVSNAVDKERMLKDITVEDPTLMVEVNSVPAADDIEVLEAEPIPGPDTVEDPPDVPLPDEVITEEELDPHFLIDFKSKIKLVYEQESKKKQEEEDQGDLLIIEL